MTLWLKGSVFCVLVWCVVAQSELNDASNFQHVVSEILRRLDEKDTQIEKLQQRLADQEKLNAEQNNRLNDQDAVIETLKQRLRTFEAESATPAETMATATSMSSNGSTSGLTQAENDGVRKSQQRIRQAMAERPVAFFATLSTDLQHAGANQPIVFDRVVTNIGSAYNLHVGVFSAPVSGIYVFSVSLLNYAGHTTGYQFRKNNDVISNIFLHAPDTSHFESTSQSVVIQLTKGDDVTLRNMSPNESLRGDNYCTFAGFLVWEDLSQPVVVGK